MYILVILAALLFAVNFLFGQMYQKICGDGLQAAALSSTIGSLISIVYMLILGGFRLQFTWFSLLMALLFSLNGFASLYCGLKAFKTADLSLYSVFMMLGGMIIPFMYGIIFVNEALTIGKILCVLFIVASIVFTYEKGKSSKKAYFFYFAIFILNGTVGILETAHQNATLPIVNSTSFIAMQSMFSFVIASIILITKRKSIPRVTPRVIGIIGGSVALSSVASLLSLVGIKVIPASIHFCIITGGVMVFSTVISLLSKEKLSYKTFISTGLALVATVLVML